ncbi:class I SAM-dependent methyltransferase [Leptolyngbya boryana CZ1]|uniref:Class I SAM-dependent methyltransferase n=1 Tax=Leptolyngbya boryana CZ1 TaxID=3060204 RepID=A0AA96X3D1_LEPBY|nr:MULTISPECIES: class I SAM-dependent methyltransferase [Leptolyngbya]MBN8564158.1 class I SAM-dependent methyltransferase [Leptolyngbya sp. UWPOB_LEPTO1]WNZ49124.1 class I SAM-dependent methyltransferase [Leptolyngbya boryana CZ1]
MRRSLKFLGVLIALSVVTIQPTITQAQPSSELINPAVPYVPTPEEVVMGMLELANVGREDIVYDLGSGDGRLVITAAQKFGAKRGVGVEINPGLVNRSNANAREAGVSDRVQFIQQDLFQTNFSEASVVTLYLLPKINLQLRPKLLSDLKPGSRVVSHAFAMGDWTPDKRVLVNNRSAYLWIIPAPVEGTWTGTLSSASGQSIPYTLQMKQTFQNASATGEIAGTTISLPQIKLVGDRFTLEHRQKFKGQDIQVRINAQVVQNTLKGTAEVLDGTSTQTFTLNGQRS